MFEVRQRQREVSADVSTENNHQLAKWGIQSHSMIYFLGILMEEVGEVAEAVMVQSFGMTEYEDDLVWRIFELGMRAKAYVEGREPDDISRVNDDAGEINLDAEVVQVAAVAVAMCESLRRANTGTVAV